MRKYLDSKEDVEEEQEGWREVEDGEKSERVKRRIERVEEREKWRERRNSLNSREVEKRIGVERSGEGRRKTDGEVEGILKMQKEVERRQSKGDEEKESEKKKGGRRKRRQLEGREEEREQE